jgi:hypothetical protein
MTDRFLKNWKIAVSISDSPDLAARGLGERHLCDVMVEVARHLIAAGATLVYGGDLTGSLEAASACRSHPAASARLPPRASSRDSATAPTAPQKR